MGRLSFKVGEKVNRLSILDIVAFSFVLGLFVFENATFSVLFQVIQSLFVGIVLLYAFIRRKIVASRIFAWLGIFFFASCVILAINLSFADNGTMSIIIKNIVRCICLTIYITSERDYKKIISFIAVSGIVCSVFILSEFIASGMDFSNLRYASNDRIGASIAGGNVNIVAMNMSFSFPAWLYILKECKMKKWKIWCIIGIIFTVSTSLLTGTRKLLLFYISVFAIYVFLSGSIRLKKILIGMLVLAVAYYCILNIEPLYYLIGHKIDFMGNSNAAHMYDQSDSVRDNLIKSGMEIFYEHPILGIGFGGTSKVLGMYTHNNFVEVLASGGIVGFMIYYIIYAYILIKSAHYRKKDPVALYIFASVVGLCMLEYFQVTYLYGMLWVFLALAGTYCEKLNCQ